MGPREGSGVAPWNEAVEGPKEEREGEYSDRRYLALVLTCARGISLWLSDRASDLRSRGRWFEPRWW